MDKKQNEKRYDTVIITLIAVLFAAVIAGLMIFNLSDAVKAIIWLLYTLLATIGMYFTSMGKQILNFVNESKIELLKVVWPTKQETVQTTTIVMLMVTITGFVLWAADSFIMYMIAKITRIG